jgi:hypothetical protein
VRQKANTEKLKEAMMIATQNLSIALGGDGS